MVNKGDRFGRIVALERVESEKQAHLWRWRCDCHSVFLRESRAVRYAFKKRGNTSCGCLKLESDRKSKNKTHGLSVRTILARKNRGWSDQETLTINPKRGRNQHD